MTTTAAPPLPAPASAVIAHASSHILGEGRGRRCKYSPPEDRVQGETERGLRRKVGAQLGRGYQGYETGPRAERGDIEAGRAEQEAV